MDGKFKLITGLGNKDKNKVKDLVLLWVEAGADIFDTSCAALPFVQEACVNRGVNLNDFEFCVSVSILGDIHGKKAKINQILCKKCGACARKCSEGAMNPPFVDELKCIGCAHCKKVCKYGAIEFFDDKNDDLSDLLKTNSKVDTIEVHISTKDKKEIIKEFKKILKLADGRVNKISVCLNREYFSNLKTRKLLAKLKELTEGFEFVVQADGNSMNGGNNSLAGTIEAVAFGLYVKSLGYDVILSGGCNEYTAELAHKAGLKCSIAYGSFARKITTLNEAKEFVLKTKEMIND